MISEANQIRKDMDRTFPLCDFFKIGEPGQIMLQRLLKTFCKYDEKVGYIQGMNFIVGSLLYHCSEIIAFWIFVAIFEDYELRDIYLPGI